MQLQPIAIGGYRILTNRALRRTAVLFEGVCKSDLTFVDSDFYPSALLVDP